ncbi:MAG TPA: PQQ-binding-like beta-propeller repeat protein [Polyangia bacterium]|jgi:hypothetical protein
MPPITRILVIASCVLGGCAKAPDYSYDRGGRGGAAGATARGGMGGGAGTGGVGAGAAGAAGAGIAGGSGGGAGSGGGRGGTTGSGVLQHHNHASRDGVYVDALLTRAAVATLQLDPNFAPTYGGPVWAQPLYLDGVGGKPDLLFVATNQNHVLAYDGMTGALIWDRALGTQAVRPDTVCSPGPVGIVGTPIIDGGARVLYVDALTGGDNHKHLVFALDADTGATRAGWPVDVDATARVGTLAFTSSTQNQRGALALLGGTLFVPYGGFGGDCGNYRGWVVGISTTDPTRVSAWATRFNGGGIWAPAGISSDGASIYFATGNTSRPSTWLDGEGVFKLSPTLEPTADATRYFVPANWFDLDYMDADLGGTAPVLVDVPGAPNPRLVALFGKDANLYLLDRDNLGGMSAPLSKSPVLWYQIMSAHAAYTTPTGTYVISRGPVYDCQSNPGSGYLFAAKIAPTSPPTVTIPWCQVDFYSRSSNVPAVTMVDGQGTDAIVWLVGDGGDLLAIDGETGEYVMKGALGTITDFSRHLAPIFTKGRVFVAGNSRVYAFKPAP